MINRIYDAIGSRCKSGGIVKRKVGYQIRNVFKFSELHRREKLYVKLDNMIFRFRTFRYRIGNAWRLLTSYFFESSIHPSDAVTIFAHSFDCKKNHFIIDFLTEYERDPNIHIEDSSLAKFHSKFCPETTEEALGVQSKSRHELFVYPWGVFGSLQVRSTKNRFLSRFCGPSSESFVDLEGEKIVTLFKSLKIKGYSPTTYPNSFIRGVWMHKKSGDKRFVVLQGNHRMAILSYLGYQKIAVRNDQFSVKNIREIEVGEWPKVVSGEVSEEEAINIFNKFFE
ncbi:hypothetical protein OAW22_02375 [Pseudomonadales bacterium]|nr:hypothetical protein [Pseudomonadales bacterium]